MGAPLSLGMLAVARACHRFIPASAGTSQDGPAVEPVGPDPGRSHGCCCGRLVPGTAHHSRETLESLRKRSPTCRRSSTISNLRGTLDAWIARHRPETLHSNALAGQINEINDRVLRFELFKLATHYWEARWLLELDDFLTSHDADRKSPAKVIRKLRRFTKLTPCFVSTFYMTPSTFMAGEYQDLCGGISRYSAKSIC